MKHRVVLFPSGKHGEIPAGTTVLDAAETLGIDIESICGGRQVCGKCLVAPEVPNQLSPPDATEQSYALQHHLDLSEVRLSCAACIESDVTITVPESSLARKQIVRKTTRPLTIDVFAACQLYYVEVTPSDGATSDWWQLRQALDEQHSIHSVEIDPALLPSLQPALKDGNGALTLVLWDQCEVIALYPGYWEDIYGLAVDVGSTTIAGHLCNLRTGEVAATSSMMNPQARYGDDIMTRISHSMMNDDGTEQMRRAVVKALNQIAQETIRQAEISPETVVDAVLVGNTVMHHILLGVNPIELGSAPFTPAIRQAINITSRDLGLKSIARGAKAYILPCIAGHVGADNTAVLLAEAGSLDDRISLIVDIGTNAEILLGTRDQIFSASSPTGPAFEGAQITHGQRAAVGAIERVRIENGAIRYKVIGDERWSDELAEHESLSPTGICGSGIIEVIVEMLLAGLIDSSGLYTESLHPQIRKNGKTSEFVLVLAEKSASGQEIIITQQDIRAIQLAKGALYAGVRLLMDHMGVSQVDCIKLAGGFGSYIDPKYAMILGMIPDCDLDAIQSVGNAAGDGAMMALLNVEERQRIERLAANVRYVETALEPSFQDYFVGAMGIPHATDPYPHLQDILKKIVKADLTKKRTQRMRRTRLD